MFAEFVKANKEKETREYRVRWKLDVSGVV